MSVPSTAATIIVIGLSVGAVTTAWAMDGADIFLAYAEIGLAWCF